MFENIIGLKKGNYYWVRYKLNDPEIMRVEEKSNYIDLCFACIGSSYRFELDEITILKEVEGV